MGSIRARSDTKMLFFDFIFQMKRCREQTTLADTLENRKKMQKVMKQIEAEITLGIFDYSKYFPNSPMVQKFSKKQVESTSEEDSGDIPRFENFAWEWFDENAISWKRSYKETLKVTLNRYLIPEFGQKVVSRITKADALKFRSTLAKVPNGTKTGLSADRINHIMTPLRMILAEAADRHNFNTPFVGIKQLRVPKTDVDPFSLDEVNLLINNVRPDFRNYYTVRFFTGMRTGEIDGLKWQYVNLERKEIYIRETIVLGKEDTTKTIESQRTIQMSKPVYDALKSQHSVTGELGKFVFCNRAGDPYDYHNVNNGSGIPR